MLSNEQEQLCMWFEEGRLAQGRPPEWVREGSGICRRQCRSLSGPEPRISGNECDQPVFEQGLISPALSNHGSY
jgi:hypothetical protein